MDAKFLTLVLVPAVLGGLKIPRDDCEWRQGGLGDMANRCDGDMLVVGACGSGFNNDCPGGAFTLVECCRVPEFYYGTCEVRGGSWGVLCRAHAGSGGGLHRAMYVAFQRCFWVNLGVW